MTNMALTALGAGAGLVFHTLARIGTALFWPRTAAAVLAAALGGAALGAAAYHVFLEERGRKDGVAAPALTAAWGLGALGVFLAFALGDPAALPAAFAVGALFFLLVTALLTLENRDEKGWGAGPFFIGLAVSWGALAAAPCLHPASSALLGTAFAALAALIAAVERRRHAVVFGAGGLLALAAALLTHGGDLWNFEGGASLPAASRREIAESWCGADRIEAAVGSGRSLVSVNRGMRNIIAGEQRAFRPDVPLGRPADGRLDVLALGYPSGDIMAALLAGAAWHENTRATIVEKSPSLRRIMEDSWPLIGEAVTAGRLEILGGNPRHRMAREKGFYDFIILDDGPSPEAHREGARAFREDYTLTAESFREILRILEPDGLLLVRRTGTGRTVMTLRKAVEGRDGAAFPDQVIVTGRPETPVAECYFRPAGFSGEDVAWTGNAMKKRRGQAFYRPRRRWNSYYDLITRSQAPGLAYMTPQDLSPARDGRPFFDHLERLRISPSGPALPEEKSRYGAEWGLQLIPPGDGAFWWAALAVFLAIPAVLLIPLAVYHHRTGLGRHGASLLWPLFLAGTAAAAGWRSLAAFALRFDPWGGAGDWAAVVFFVACGGAWSFASRHDGAWKRFSLVFAAAAMAMGAAGYDRAGRLLNLETLPLVLVVALAAAAAGLLLGGFAGGIRAAAALALPGAAGLVTAALLLGLAGAWPLAALAAVTFGLPTLWLIAGGAALAACYAARDL